MKLYKRLFIPDTHAGFHDPRAVECMLDVAKDFRPDEVVYLGDFQDCYSVSQYDKDPEKNFNLLKEEIAPGKDLMDKIERVTRAKSFVFLAGNHENRIDRYIATYAAKLGGLVSAREILQIPDSYKYFPYGQQNHYRCGKLIATHGSLTTKHSAAAMLAKYGASVVYGHTHTIQEFRTRNINGDEFVALNIGWLGDMAKAAEYVKSIANWSHGFGIAYFKPNGDFFFQTIPILSYQCVFNGRLFANVSKQPQAF